MCTNSIALGLNHSGNTEDGYSYPTKWVLPHRSLLPPAPKHTLLAKALLLLVCFLGFFGYVRDCTLE